MSALVNFVATASFGTEATIRLFGAPGMMRLLEGQQTQHTRAPRSLGLCFQESEDSWFGSQAFPFLQGFGAFSTLHGFGVKGAQQSFSWQLATSRGAVHMDTGYLIREKESAAIASYALHHYETKPYCISQCSGRLAGLSLRSLDVGLWLACGCPCQPLKNTRASESEWGNANFLGLVASRSRSLMKGNQSCL